MKHLITIIALITVSMKAWAYPKTLLEHGGVDVRKMLKSNNHIGLLIIDAQNEYVFGKLPLYNIKNAVRQAENVLTLARRHHVPIIHVQQMGKSHAALFAKDSTASDFIPELTPLTDEIVIQKHLPNAFVNTPLLETLRKNQIDKLIVVGFMTHMCVSSTVRSALDFGFQSIVVEDATATRDLPESNHTGIIKAKSLQRSAIAALQDRFAFIVQASDLERLLYGK